MRKDLINILKDLILIAVGAFIYAFGVNYFFVANGLLDGGFAGICVILHYLFGFNISMMYLVLNIPVIVLGYKLIGGKFILRTFYGTAMTSLAFKVFENLYSPMNDKLIAAIFGGILIGIGLGTIFIGGGSSGGSDILVKILNKYFDVSIGKSFLIMDTVVLSTAGLLFGREVFMYTLVGVFISTKAIDFIQDGIEKSRGIMIISDKTDEIIAAIDEKTGRGTTIINGKGGYTRDHKEILYCVVRRYEETTIKRIIRKIDRRAFVTVMDVTDVLGEGFKEI